MTKTLFVVIVVAVIAAAIYYERRRGDAMEGIAQRLGLQYQAGRDRLPGELLDAGFDLFTQGPPLLRFYLEGEENGDTLALFEFTYNAAPGGEGEAEMPLQDDQVGIERRAQTVLWIHRHGSLPDFDLAPATGIHQRRVAGRFGFVPVTFDGERAFNQTYLLLGRDAGRLRRLFDGPLRDYLLQHPGLVVEARGQDLLIYRFGELVAPKRLPDFLQQGRELAALLRPGGGTEPQRWAK